MTRRIIFMKVKDLLLLGYSTIGHPSTAQFDSGMWLFSQKLRADILSPLLNKTAFIARTKYNLEINSAGKIPDFTQKSIFNQWAENPQDHQFEFTSLYVDMHNQISVIGHLFQCSLNVQ